MSTDLMKLALEHAPVVVGGLFQCSCGLSSPDDYFEQHSDLNAWHRMHVMRVTAARVLIDAATDLSRLPFATERYQMATANILGQLLKRARKFEEGQCGADITHRDEHHRQSVCVRESGHSGAHDDGQGCVWTGGNQ